MTDDEKRIDELVDLLGCSIAEAKQMVADDKAIDKGEKLFEMTPEQKAVSKQYRQGERKPTIYSFTKRERKADTTKEGVIAEIAKFLEENGYESVEITNKSKIIAFKIGEDNYELNLIRKRKPKK